MKCERCGGLVTWRGPLSALTHTQCDGCDGINCQVVADECECETCGGEGTIDERIGGEWNSNPSAKCPECDGRGYYTVS